MKDQMRVSTQERIQMALGDGRPPAGGLHQQGKSWGCPSRRPWPCGGEQQAADRSVGPAVRERCEIVAAGRGRGGAGVVAGGGEGDEVLAEPVGGEGLP